MSRYMVKDHCSQNRVSVTDARIVEIPKVEFEVAPSYVAVHDYWLEHKGVLHDEILTQRECMLWEVKRIEEEMLSQAVMFREKSEVEMQFLRTESQCIVASLLDMEVEAWRAVKKREGELFELQSGFTECMGEVVCKLVAREFDLAVREKALWERRYELENWSTTLHNSLVSRESSVRDQSRRAQMDIALLQGRKHNRLVANDSDGFIEVYDEEISRISGSGFFSVKGRVVPLPRRLVTHKVLDSDTDSVETTPLQRTLSNGTTKSESAKRTPSMRSNRSVTRPSRALPTKRATSRQEKSRQKFIEEEVVEETPDVSVFEGLPITLSYFEGVGGRLRGTTFTSIDADGTFCFSNVCCLPLKQKSTKVITTTVLTEAGEEVSKSVISEVAHCQESDLSGHSHALRVCVPKQQDVNIEDGEAVVSMRCKTVLIQRRRLLEQRSPLLELKEFSTSAIHREKRMPLHEMELVEAVNFVATGEWNPSIMTLKGTLNFLNVESFGLFGTEVTLRLRCTTSTDEQLDILPSSDHNQQRSSSDTATSDLVIASHSGSDIFNTKSTATLQTNPTVADIEGQNHNNPAFDIRTTIKCLGNESNQFHFNFNLLCVPGSPSTWAQLIQPTKIRHGLFVHDDPEEKRESRRAPEFCRFFMELSVPQTRYSDAFRHEFEINVLEMLSERPYFVYEAASILEERVVEFADVGGNSNPLPLLTPPPPQQPQHEGQADQHGNLANETLPLMKPPSSERLTLSRHSSLRRSTSPLSEVEEVDNPPTFQLASQSVPIPLHDCVHKCRMSHGGGYMAVIDTAGDIRVYRKRLAASKAEAFVLGSPDSAAVAAVVASSPNRVRDSFRDASASPSPKRHHSSILTIPSDHELKRSGSSMAAVQGSSDDEVDKGGAGEELRYHFWQEQLFIESGRGHGFTHIVWSTPPSTEITKGSRMDYLAAYESTTKKVYVWNLHMLRTFAASASKGKGKVFGSSLGLNSPERANSEIHHEGGSSGHKNAFGVSLGACRSACYGECLLDDVQFEPICAGLAPSPELLKRTKRAPLYCHLSVEHRGRDSPFHGPHDVRLIFVTSLGEVTVTHPSAPALSEGSLSSASTLFPVTQLRCSTLIGPFTAENRAFVTSVALCRNNESLIMATSTEAADVAIQAGSSPSTLSRLGNSEVTVQLFDLASGKRTDSFAVETLVELSRTQRGRNHTHQASEPVTVPTPTLRYYGCTSSSTAQGPQEHHFFVYSLGVVILSSTSKGFSIAHADSEEIGVSSGDGAVSSIVALVPVERRKVALVYATNDVFVLDLVSVVREQKGFVQDTDTDRNDPYLIQSLSMNPTNDDLSSPAAVSALDPTTISTSCNFSTGEFVLAAVDGMGPLCWEFIRRGYVAAQGNGSDDVQ